MLLTAAASAPNYTRECVKFDKIIGYARSHLIS